MNRNKSVCGILCFSLQAHTRVSSFIKDSGDNDNIGINIEVNIVREFFRMGDTNVFIPDGVRVGLLAKFNDGIFYRSRVRVR